MSRLFIQVNDVDVEVTLQSTKEFTAGMIEAAMQLAQIGLREAITATPTASTDDGQSVPSKSSVTKSKPKAISSATLGARLSNADMIRAILAEHPQTLQEAMKSVAEKFAVSLDSQQVSSVLHYLRSQGVARRRDNDGRWEMAKTGVPA